MAYATFSPVAEDDIDGISAEISQDKPHAALRWVQKIRETCEMLAEHPHVGELRLGFGVPGCRSFSVGNYVIFFRAANDGIEVARIVHGSRDMRNL